MSSSFQVLGLGEIGKQAAALGAEAKPAINAALLKGAKVIAAEAELRAPRARKRHSKAPPKRLAESLTAENVSKKNTSGVTVKGGIRGPHYYWKFVEHGTTKMKARKFVAQSAEAKEAEVADTVADTLKEKLGF